LPVGMDVAGDQVGGILIGAFAGPHLAEGHEAQLRRRHPVGFDVFLRMLLQIGHERVIGQGNATIVGHVLIDVNRAVSHQPGQNLKGIGLVDQL